MLFVLLNEGKSCPGVNVQALSVGALNDVGGLANGKHPHSAVYKLSLVSQR